jgi:CelD/BcsL family acetyltransferase involved in cellulose biosynthesis
MSIRIVQPSDLTDYEVGEWLRLQQRDPLLQSPYLCPEFVSIAATIRPGVVVLVVRELGIPKAILPLQMRGSSAGPVACPLSDYQALIAAQDWQCDIRRLLQDAHISAYDFMHHSLNRCIEPFCRAVEAAPIILLEHGFEAYVEEARRRVTCANVSGKPHQTLKRIARVERNDGPVRFTWHEASPLALNRLFAWKSAQYHRSGKVLSVTDCFSFPWTRLLLERIHAEQGPNFAGVLSTLHIGDDLVAVHMGMRSENVLHWWFPAYDPAYGRLSPGLILLTKLCEAAAGMGIRQIDLGPGAEPYKKLVANREQTMVRGFVSCGVVSALPRLAVHHVDRIASRLPIGCCGTWPGRLIRRMQRARWLAA